MSSDGKVIIDTELNAKDAEKQSKSLGNSLSSGLAKGAKVATAGVMAVGTAVAVTGTKMIKSAKETAEYGDHIDKMSQKLGISAEAYQKWDYVAKISGTSIDGLKMGFKTLTNTIDKANQGDKTAIENFKRVGMSMDDLKGKSKEDIFKTTIESLQNMEDATERSAMANKLLGRAGMELGPMLNSEKGSIDELMKTAEDYGMVMSDKAVKASAKFQDSLTTMGMTFTGLKNRMMGEFLPSMTQVTDGLALVFKGDTEQGIEKINEGITNFIGKMSEIAPKVLELGGNIIMTLATAILQNLPQLLTTGTQIALELLQGLINAVPSIITGLLGAIPTILNTLMAQLPTIINTLINGLTSALSSLSKSLPTIVQSGMNLILGLVQGIVTALPTLVPMLIQTGMDLVLALMQGLVEALPTLIEMLPTLIQSIIDTILNSLPILINGVVQLVTMLVENLPTIIMTLINALPQIIVMIINGLMSALPQLINGIIQLVLMLVQNLPKIILALIKALPKAIVMVVQALIKNLPTLIKGLIQLVIEIVKNLPKIILEFIKAIPTILVEIVKALITNIPILFKGILNMIVGLVKKLPSLLSKLWEFIKTLPSKILSFLIDLPQKATKLGSDMIRGLWNGIKNLGNWIWSKIKGFFNGMVGAIKKLLGIKSPSTLFRDQVGKFIAQGIWVGFDEENPMKQINDSILHGTQQLETNFKSQALLNINEGIANAVKTGFENANVEMKVGERDFARLTKGAMA